MDTVELLIDNVTLTGDGVGRKDDGKVLFVPRTLPGERVNVSITSEKKSFGHADVVDLIEAAADRISPDCDHFEHCGGCAFWHTNLAFEHKINAAKSTLARIGKYDGPTSSVPAPRPTEWRIRANFHVIDGVIGFFRRGTHDVFEIVDCLVLDPRLKAALKAVQSHAPSGNGSIFIETSGPSAHVTITGEIANAWRPLESDAISGVTVERRKRDDRDVEIEMLGETVEIPSGLFRQGNDDQNRLLTDAVVEAVPEGSDIAEYFCGYGNFSFPLSTKAKSVHAYEADEIAISTARHLATTLSRTNVTFEVTDLFLHVPRPESANVVVLDPPRAGANRLCETLAESEDVQTIVYVSCDVATLGRDLVTLRGGGFEIREVTFFDLFPQTGHLESLVVLDRR